MKPKLISFNLCPFVQRARIVLAHKGVEHDIEYIDLSNPPSWFADVSPLRKVPVLQVDDKVIFESAVISEFLDEAYPGRLHPDDVFERAMNRSWIEFGTDCLFKAHQLVVSQSEAAYRDARDVLWSKLDQLEHVVRAKPYFNGEVFSLVDSAYAPMFQRLDYLNALQPDVYDAARHPKVMRWKDALLAHDAVRQSEIPGLHAVFHDFVRNQQGYFAAFL